MWIELNEYKEYLYDGSLIKKETFLINSNDILYVQFYDIGSKTIIKINEEGNEIYTERIENPEKYYKIILNDKNYSQFIIDEADYQSLKNVLVNQKGGWKD